MTAIKVPEKYYYISAVQNLFDPLSAFFDKYNQLQDIVPVDRRLFSLSDYR